MFLPGGSGEWGRVRLLSFWTRLDTVRNSILEMCVSEKMGVKSEHILFDDDRCKCALFTRRT